MAVELRNALAAAIGRRLQSTLLFKYPSLEALAGFLTNELLAEAPNAPASDPEPDEDVAAIAPLTDDEVSRLLAEEIRFLSQN